MRVSIPMVLKAIEAQSSKYSISLEDRNLLIHLHEKRQREAYHSFLTFASCQKDGYDFDEANHTQQITQNTQTIRSLAHPKHVSLTDTKAIVTFPVDSHAADMGYESNHDRLQRSRERNRIHARKTRQRKKEQMKTLTQRADELKNEQIRLKQCINEKTTASILVGLFASTENGGEQRIEHPRVEALLRRPAEEIPDAAKLPELPALILPGQHNSKKHKEPGALPKQELPDDGIDYDLLGKDRSKCTPAELDQIRRERNRMHAKRTRDRKRFFMEEMAEMCKTLEDENGLLQLHLDSLNSNRKDYSGSVVSPALSSQQPGTSPSNLTIPTGAMRYVDREAKDEKASVSAHGVTLDQINTLLEAASTFSSSAVSESSHGESDGDHQEERHHKRRRLNDDKGNGIAVPNSIITTSPTAAGC